MAEFTPMMKQYFAVKEEYKDCILMYRLGDFYEMFFEDALEASRILEITLTGRDCGQEERAPMCGVPFHAVDSYIAKLVENGKKVAICEQTENPAEAKGIVRREVVRVITPGTILDSSALDDKKNNYLCSLYVDKAGVGISFVDITTGEISTVENAETTDLVILNEMVKYAPSEVIANKNAMEREELVEKIKDRFSCSVLPYSEDAYSFSASQSKIKEILGSGYKEEIEGKVHSCASLGALLSYLEETQKTEPNNLKELDIIDDGKYMGIDLYSMRNLELLETMRDKKAKGSLLNVLNKTVTSMGSRLMRKWVTMPLINCGTIQNRHNAVEEFFKNPVMREEIREELRGINDIERTITRISYKSANCKDLLGIAFSFEKLPKIKALMKDCQTGVLKGLYEGFDTLSDIKELIDNSINPKAPLTVREGDLIKDGYNEEIDKTRVIIKEGKQWIKDIIDREREETGLKIKEGYNRVFGYYLEISKAEKGDVPPHFIRRQTLANCERYITEEIKEIEDKIVEAESSIVAMEYEMFCQIREKVGSEISRIQKTAEVVATIDVLTALAFVAEKNGYTKPKMNLGDKLFAKDARHPVVEKLGSRNMFIPNDINIDCQSNQVLVITGPNMAGKSTYMRQTALLSVMAQMGSFVPASEAELGIVDSIFTRVGASDDLSAGQSTFMVEMSEVAYILDNATKNSLIILDEIGRGTSTYDGLSIAWSVVEYLADKKKCGAKTLFATHYRELLTLEEKIEGVKNYCIAVRKQGDSITFLRKIIRGGADGSYGVEVAALAGVKKEVTERAKTILREVEEREGIKSASTNPKFAPKQRESEMQMSFMESGVNTEIIDEIKNIDIDSMTPMGALTKLYELKAKAKNG
ncbi:MAG: DNA mismatch repair protein MutS [Clostridia bacterium]|nr:DNA mismatch repair protein MutS [Clostridia bacterium]